MKLIPRALAVWFTFAVCTVGALASELFAERTWTNVSGRTAKATYISTEEDGRLLLERASDGKEFRVPIQRLSDEYRNFVIEMIKLERESRYTSLNTLQDIEKSLASGDENGGKIRLVPTPVPTPTPTFERVCRIVCVPVTVCSQGCFGTTTTRTIWQRRCICEWVEVPGASSGGSNTEGDGSLGGRQSHSRAVQVLACKKDCVN